MSAVRDPEFEPPVLPELEQLLVRAARRRAAPRFGRRRWALAVALGALVLAAAAAAATGVLRIAGGTTAHGTFSVERAVGPGVRQGGSSVCLQLRYNGRGPSYGCGEAPTAAQPFGLVVADRYRGRIISAAEVHRLGLSCISGRKANRCFNTPAEAEEAALGHL